MSPSWFTERDCRNPLRLGSLDQDREIWTDFEIVAWVEPLTSAVQAVPPTPTPTPDGLTHAFDQCYSTLTFLYCLRLFFGETL